MSGKDAEIERAFERAERDEENRQVIPGAIFTEPLLLWKHPTPCPECLELASFKIKCGEYWYAVCLPCQRYWPLETDNERDDDDAG